MQFLRRKLDLSSANSLQAYFFHRSKSFWTISFFFYPSWLSRNLNKFQDTRYKFYYYIIVYQIKYLIKSLSTKLKIQVKFFFQVIRRRSIRYHSFKHNLDYSSRHSAISTCFSISKKKLLDSLKSRNLKKISILGSIAHPSWKNREIFDFQRKTISSRFSVQPRVVNDLF